MSTLNSKIIYLLAVLLLSPFIYLFVVIVSEFISIRSIDINSVGRGITYEGLKPQKNAVIRRTGKLLLGLSKKDAFLIWANAVLAIVAVSGFIFTTLTYYDAVKINKNAIEVSKNLNRPYIDLDTKSIKEDLVRMSEMVPVGENLYREIPAEENLRFSIKNYGTLPAKYKIDFSDFRNSGFKIISERVDIDYIYPEQTEELIFTYDYDSRASSERMIESLYKGRDIFGDLGKIDDEYIIKIKYGPVFQEKPEFLYETTIRRRYYRVPCEDGGDLKNANTSCWRHKWMIIKVN